MLFTADVTVLTTNTVGNPEVEILKIAHGIITWVSIHFPPGCHRLVHCVILHHEHQIAPSTENMDLAGDNFPIEWDEYYESYQPPYELKIKVWTEDDTYPHTIAVRVAVLPRKAIVLATITDTLKEFIKSLMPRAIFPRKE